MERGFGISQSGKRFWEKSEWEEVLGEVEVCRNIQFLVEFDLGWKNSR